MQRTKKSTAECCLSVRFHHTETSSSTEPSTQGLDAVKKLGKSTIWLNESWFELNPAASRSTSFMRPAKNLCSCEVLGVEAAFAAFVATTCKVWWKLHSSQYIKGSMRPSGRARWKRWMSHYLEAKGTTMAEKIIVQLCGTNHWCLMPHDIKSNMMKLRIREKQTWPKGIWKCNLTLCANSGLCIATSPGFAQSIVSKKPEAAGSLSRWQTSWDQCGLDDRWRLNLMATLNLQVLFLWQWKSWAATHPWICSHERMESDRRPMLAWENPWQCRSVEVLLFTTTTGCDFRQGAPLTMNGWHLISKPAHPTAGL